MISESYRDRKSLGVDFGKVSRVVEVVLWVGEG